MPAAVEAVARELAALGVALRERSPAVEPDLWWERRPGGTLTAGRRSLTADAATWT